MCRMEGKKLVGSLLIYLERRSILVHPFEGILKLTRKEIISSMLKISV